jgi:hypothetical protein
MVNERRIGFHVKSLNDLKKALRIQGINLVELKPDKLRKNGADLYAFDGKKFRINEKVAKKIRDFCQERDIQIQLHLPYEKKVDPNVEEGLCYGIKKHHLRLIDRFKMVNDLYTQYGIGKIVVMHPPQLVSNGELLCTYNEGLEYGREFLFELDNLRKSKGLDFKVGVENMIAPKQGYVSLGYNPPQLKHLLGNTETIGLTVDSGHRLLSEEMSVLEMFGIAPIVSLHFHSNPGLFLTEGYKDDAHQLADNRNLLHFSNYLRSIRRFKIPVTCEVDIKNISDEKLNQYISLLRFMLE